MPSSIIDDIPPFAATWKPQTRSKEYWLRHYDWMNSHHLSNIMGEDLFILNSWDVEETECKHEECGWYCKEKRI